MFLITHFCTIFICEPEETEAENLICYFDQHFKIQTIQATGKQNLTKKSYIDVALLT